MVQNDAVRIPTPAAIASIPHNGGRGEEGLQALAQRQPRNQRHIDPGLSHQPNRSQHNQDQKLASDQIQQRVDNSPIVDEPGKEPAEDEDQKRHHERRSEQLAPQRLIITAWLCHAHGQ
jgi:hypothetical protein